MYSTGTHTGRGHRRAKRRIVSALAGALLAVTMLAAPAASAQPARDHLITKDGIGTASVGATAAQLRAQLGSGWTVTQAPPLLVDLVGYEVKQGPTLRFYALGDDLNGPLTVFVAGSADLQTAAGIGPNSTIDAGVAAYGTATLSFNPENESREFVRFENEPAGRIFFRTGSGDEAGIYAAGANETMDFKDGATIKSVWVTCIAGRDCPQLAITGPRQTTALIIVSLGLLTFGVILQSVSRRRPLS